MVVSHQAAFVSSSPSLPPPFPSLPFPSCGCCLGRRDGCWVAGVLAGVGVGASGGGAVPGTIVPCFILNRVSCPWFSCRVPFSVVVGQGPCRCLRGLLLLSQSFSQWSSCSFQLCCWDWTLCIWHEQSFTLSFVNTYQKAFAVDCPVVKSCCSESDRCDR